MAYAGHKGYILGICGGFQIMGNFIHDPEGLEGKPGTSRGLSLLPVETFLKAPKTTTLTRFCWQNVEGTGYEIHMGQTKRLDGEAMLDIRQRNGIPCKDQDGCVAEGFRFAGTYLHGLFDTPGVIIRWLSDIGLAGIQVSQTCGLAARDKQYDLLADYFKNHINTSVIENKIGVDL